MESKSISLSLRLYLSFLAIVVLFLGQLGYLIFEVNRLSEIQDTGARRANEAVEIGQINARVISAYEIIGDSVINRDLPQTRKDWAEFKAQGLKDIERVAVLVDTDSETKAAQRFQKNYLHYMDVFENKMMPALVAASGETTQEIRDIDGEIDEVRSTVLEPLDFVAKALHGEQQEGDEVYDSTSGLVFIVAVIVSMVGLVIAFILASWLVRSITRPLNQVIASLTSASDQIASASRQVASSSQSLAAGSGEQAASLEETSSSLEEVATMSVQNAERSRDANNLSKESSTLADKGSQSMERMVGAIQDIKTSSDETSKIIKTIDEIAFQTNLLALNAAVEAARAGEAGRGFAVVAEEVRNLALRSAEAARNTSGMIETSQEKADNGVKLAGEVTEVLDSMRESLSKTTDLIAGVTNASDEQTNGITQVNSAMTQMEGVTQSNAANAEETAAASEELSSQSQHLLGMVEQMVKVVGGSDARRGGNGGNGGSGQRFNSPARDHSYNQPQRQYEAPVKTIPLRERLEAEKGTSQPPQFEGLDDSDFKDM